MCIVKIRHNDKCVKCRFFVVPDNSSAPLGMPDVELLSTLGRTCDIIGRPHENRKVNSQTIETADSLNCRTNIGLWIQTNKEDMHDEKKTCQIISNLVQIEWQTKEWVRYLQIKFIISSVMFFQGQAALMEPSL